MANPTMSPHGFTVYAPTERLQERVTRKWRSIFVGAFIGTVCCLIGLASIQNVDNMRSGDQGKPSELLAVFKAPEIQLADVPTSLFHSKKNPAGSLGSISSRMIQLDSVRPLLDGRGTENVAEAVAALQKGNDAASTITLRGVPTEVTITLPEDVTINRQAALSGRVATSKLQEDGSHDSWAYDGPVMPPKDWGNAWKVCREGTEQSPIDIAPAEVKGDMELPSLVWKCGGKPCVGDGNASTPSMSIAEIVFDGHALRMSNFVGDGSPALKWGGQDYQLNQITMHTPSEHTIDEMYYDMEVQLEHQGPGGKTLVASALLSTGEGIHSPAWLADIVDVVRPCHLSSDPEQCRLSDAPQHLTSVFSFKALAIFVEPLLARYYSYNGSLTQPPCTEGVAWVVGTKAGKFRQADWTNIAALEGKNNRPRQKILHRVINLKP